MGDAGGRRMAAFGGAAWPSGRPERFGARVARYLGLGGGGAPQDAAPRASFTPRAREGQSAAMKWARINDIWYYTVSPAGQRHFHRKPSADRTKPRWNEAIGWGQSSAAGVALASLF